jgi:hypothetical protein
VREFFRNLRNLPAAIASMFFHQGDILAADENLVIGKLGDLLKKGALGPKEKIIQFERGLPTAEAWAKNKSILEDVMAVGKPIRDASVDPVTGELISDTGFLALEREVLRQARWVYNTATRMWHPPVK